MSTKTDFDPKGENLSMYIKRNVLIMQIEGNLRNLNHYIGDDKRYYLFTIIAEFFVERKKRSKC